MNHLSPRRSIPLLSLVIVTLGLAGCPFVNVLTITPLAVDFGELGEVESITIFNAAGGEISWTVDVEFFRLTPDNIEVPDPDADWLSVSPLSGTTTTETDRVTLSADRSGLEQGAFNARLTITDSTGEVQEVLVAIRTPGEPNIGVDPAAVNLNCPNATGQFSVVNTGDGSLAWTISVLDPDDPNFTIPFPEFLTVSPASGVTLAGSATPVTVSVDCDLIDVAVQSLTLSVNSGAGAQEVLVTIGGEGVGPEISVDPTVLDFGQDLNELIFDVFNSGEAGSMLNFTLSTDRPDLIFFEPDAGQSIGVITDLDDIDVIGQFDRIPITVTIDRSAIQGTADGGTIFVSAPGLEDVPVAVVVEAAPLTIEGAANRSRPPSVVRFVFTLRDSLGDVIRVSDPDEKDKLSFSIVENMETLDLDETNLFITGPENLKVNIALVLDFSGSMFNAGLGNGVAIEQSKDAAKEFIDNLPSAWRLGLFEFHQRQQTTFQIHPFDTDKDAMKQALDDFQLAPSEHGGSTVFDAVAAATQALVDIDSGLIELDDADVRAVVFISDGRDTSSMITADDLSSFVQEQSVRTRLFPIGFGRDIDNAPLVKLATESGGRPYSAADTAELAELLGAPGQEGLITTEFRNQIVLTYISLLQMDSTYLITAFFQVDEDTQIQGTFQRDGLIFPGDVRAGQISARTAGISNGAAEVFLRTDYTPRNMTQMRFRMFIDPNEELPPAALAALINAEPVIELAPEGLLVDPLRAERTWRLVREPDATILGIRPNFVWQVLTEEDNPLDFAAFGSLVRITFPDLDDFVAVMDSLGETPLFELGFRLDNRIYLDPPTRKFWDYPGGRLNPTEVLQVGFQANTAPPAPSTAALQVIGFDPDAPNAFNLDFSETEGGIDDFDDRFPNNDNQS